MLLRLSVHTLKEFRGCERGFAWHRTRGYTRFICYARRCCSLSYTLFSMRTWRRCGCIYALCLLFPFCARLLALSLSLPSPFCRRNNGTASAVTALRTIPCTQLFVAFLKRDKLRSWSVTPHPSNREHALKISSLALRRSATITWRSFAGAAKCEKCEKEGKAYALR